MSLVEEFIGKIGLGVCCVGMAVLMVDLASSQSGI